MGCRPQCRRTRNQFHRDSYCSCGLRSAVQFGLVHLNIKQLHALKIIKIITIIAISSFKCLILVKVFI
ncbi:unnamed protein product [Chilo suppressalis]|uniref:Uncharacterized protein n=1 Tax=Chilo suppressalis TaxID=168631 RepID=A0ABN8AZ27_CHISP|nr:unnamed protein product [Chilo suppressalis]